MSNSGTYNGHDWEVYRVEDYRESGEFPHEFFLEVDGERVASATGLENDGHSRNGSWKKTLERFAKDYIDDLEDEGATPSQKL